MALLDERLTMNEDRVQRIDAAASASSSQARYPGQQQQQQPQQPQQPQQQPQQQQSQPELTFAPAPEEAALLKGEQQRLAHAFRAEVGAEVGRPSVGVGCAVRALMLVCTCGCWASWAS